MLIVLFVDCLFVFLDRSSEFNCNLQFLPARKVEEKAKKLRKSLSKDVLYGTSSKNILAMTFRQVVMQQLLKFELVLFRPGTERDMENLENPRKVIHCFLSFKIFFVMSASLCL